MRARPLLYLLFALLLASSAPCRAEAPYTIVMEGEPDKCLDARTLRARVARYLAGAKSRRGAQVRVQVKRARGSVEFAVTSDGIVLARRHFEPMPTLCADRRDTLALAIALAIEHAATREAPFEPAIGGDGGRTDAGPNRGGGAARGRSASPGADGAVSEAPKPGTSTLPPVKPAPDAEATPSATTTPSLATTPSDPPEVTAPERPSSQVDQAPDSSSRSPLRRRLRRTALLAGARTLLGVVPAPAIAFSLGAELPILPLANFQVSGWASLPVQTSLPPGRVRAQLFGAEAMGCGHSAAALLSFHGCLGVTGATVRARGDGFVDDLSTTVAWLAGLLRVALRWSFTVRATLELGASAHVSLIRPELRIDGSEARQRALWAGGALGLSALVTFE